MGDVEVLYTNKVTPEQLLIDVANSIEKDGASEFAVVFKDGDGYYQSFTTDMKIAELHFLGVILQRRALRQSED